MHQTRSSVGAAKSKGRNERDYADIPGRKAHENNAPGRKRGIIRLSACHLVQMAWRWLQHQPNSALSKWFRDYVSARDGRSRKRGIVALARKLLVALWRYATAGLVPDGAVLSRA